jgi:cytoskeletal protein RodZ
VDHKQRHHEHHQKEREHEKAVRKEREREAGGKKHWFHPAWYLVVGAVLILIAVIVWTFLIGW